MLELPQRKSLSARLPHARSNNSLIPDTLTRPVNILFLGIDNSGHPHSQDPTHTQALAGNSDTMLLVRLMPDTHKINVLSIPRDTLVELPGKGIDKINDANVIGGAEAAAKAVSNLLFNIPIDHYVRVDTEGFVELIDTLGEVEVNIPKPMHYVDKTQKLYIDFQPGKQKLNGQHFQEYMRFRHDDLGDIGRVQRQQEALKALLQTLLKPATATKIPQLLNVIKNNVDTDFSIGEILGIFEFLSHSGTAHLRIVPALLGWTDPGSAFSAAMQLASLAGVIAYFWKDIKQLAGGTFRAIESRNFNSGAFRLTLGILVGTIPLIIFGALLKPTKYSHAHHSNDLLALHPESSVFFSNHLV